jgi:hypothetical protein
MTLKLMQTIQIRWYTIRDNVEIVITNIGTNINTNKLLNPPIESSLTRTVGRGKLPVVFKGCLQQLC